MAMMCFLLSEKLPLLHSFGKLVLAISKQFTRVVCHSKGRLFGVYTLVIVAFWPEVKRLLFWVQICQYKVDRVLTARKHLETGHCWKSHCPAIAKKMCYCSRLKQCLDLMHRKITISVNTCYACGKDVVELP